MDFPSAFDAPGVRMRPYRDTDAPDLVTGLNDPETRRFQQGAPAEISQDRARAWIREAPGRFAPGSDRVVYAVADLGTDELLAGVLIVVNPSRRSAEIGFWVCPAARGRGVATATARALSDLCFAQGVRRVEMLIHRDNLPSRRVAHRAGFRLEGTLREAIPGAGDERYDAVLLARLPSDTGGSATDAWPGLPGAG